MKNLIEENEKNNKETIFDRKWTGKFKKIHGKSIQQIIAQNDLKNAVIQSASTSSGLEGGMHKSTSYLSNMQQNAVQGETVAACLLWGNIYRKYYIPIANYHPGLDSDEIKIGIQKNTTIAYEADMASFNNGIGYYSQKLNKTLPYLKRTNNTKTTSQIMAFALNFNKIQKTPNNITCAKELLKRQYLMTIWAANINGIRDVYLTYLGGGAFKNDTAWINDAIDNDELQDFIKRTGMRVYLVAP